MNVNRTQVKTKLSCFVSILYEVRSVRCVDCKQERLERRPCCAAFSFRLVQLSHVSQRRRRLPARR